MAPAQVAGAHGVGGSMGVAAALQVVTREAAVAVAAREMVVALVEATEWESSADEVARGGQVAMAGQEVDPAGPSASASSHTRHRAHLTVP